MRGLPRMSSGLAGLIALLVLVGLLVTRFGGDGPSQGAPERPPASASPVSPSPAASGEDATRARGGKLVPVLSVTDGDTIHVARRGDETIRLIGIDTPEVDWYGGEAECFGAEAGYFLRDLLEGERVRLEEDLEKEDRYDRSLAYVYLEDGRMVNLVLVRRGYAVVTIYEPNDRYEPELRAAEAEARSAGRGLWSAC